MNFAIVGCGLIGQKRLRALQALDEEHILLIAADPVLERANRIAAQYPDAESTSDWRAAVVHPKVDIVIVSTTNDWLAPITIAAIRNNKHVLVEKPAARNPKELESVIEAAEQNSVCVRVGLNHRYHPAFQKARQIVDSGQLGMLMFVRGRYGHGGRSGYDKEWRAKPEIAGGGELLDQGIHLIDLSRWFLGDFVQVSGYAATYYWNMRVEDNGFLMLRNAQEQLAWLHVSCTEWKNLFSFEIYGKDGKLQIDGQSGSYGTERLAYYKMLPQMGPPDTTIWEYPGDDKSWQIELNSFLRSIDEKQRSSHNLQDAKAALEIVHQIYASQGVRKAKGS